MHRCPSCDSACYCDLDDSNCALDDILDCEHECEDDEDEDDWFGDDMDEDGEWTDEAIIGFDPQC